MGTKTTPTSSTKDSSFDDAATRRTKSGSQLGWTAAPRPRPGLRSKSGTQFPVERCGPGSPTRRGASRAPVHVPLRRAVRVALTSSVVSFTMAVAVLLAGATPVLASPSREAVPQVAAAPPVLRIVSPSVVTAHLDESFSFTPEALLVPGRAGFRLTDAGLATSASASTAAVTWSFAPEGRSLAPSDSGLPPGITAHEAGSEQHGNVLVLSGVPRALGSYAVELVARQVGTTATGPGSAGSGITGPGPARLATQRLVIDVAPRVSVWESSSFAFATAPDDTTGIAVPGAVDYAVPGDETMLANTTVNDCEVAAGYHLVLAEAGALGITLPTPTDATALGIYRELIAGPIATNDTGASTSGLIGLLATSGLDGIHAIAASQLGDPRDIHSVEVAVTELGGVLATLARTPVDSSVALWTSGAPEISSSHEVAVLGYDATGPLLATWGRLVRASWSWWDANVTSVHLVVPDLYRRLGHGPTAIPIATLLARFGGAFSSPRALATRALVVQPGQDLYDAIGASGYPEPSVTVTGVLPAGLGLQPDGNGTEITGQPTARAAGTYPLLITASSPTGVTLTTITVSVAGPPAIDATPWLDVTTVGAPFNFTVEDYPGPGVVITVGSLVTGLHARISAAGVVITGAGEIPGQVRVTRVAESRDNVLVYLSHLEVIVAGPLSS